MQSFRRVEELTEDHDPGTSAANDYAPNSDVLSVYIHWPFCLSKCPYCDFNSHVSASISHNIWRTAFLSEINRMVSWLGFKRVRSIFFGGGTPSLMEPKTVSSILDLLAKHWTIEKGAEITLEANPSSSDVARFRDFRCAGINRLSLGIQALEEGALKFLGREHSVKEGIRAAHIAASIFERTSIDLIYGRPGQQITEWRRELRTALELVDTHISAYQLTIEKGTPFYDLFRRGSLTIPSDDSAAALYEITQEFLHEAGLPSYEISNHAAEGYESVHNLAYWRYQDYLGIGPGAHSRIMINSQIYAVEQFRTPQRWLRAATSENNGILTKTALGNDQCVREMVMMGLRLKTGLDHAWFRQRLSTDLEDVLDLSMVSTLKNTGLIIDEKGTFRLTRSGFLVINSILNKLLR